MKKDKKAAICLKVTRNSPCSPCLCASARRNYEYAKEGIMNIKRYRQILMLTAVLILLPVLAFAQTAAEMDTMLAADTVSSARAARFVLGAADLLPAGLSGNEAERAAYDMASSSGWIKASPGGEPRPAASAAGSGEAVTMKDAAFLIMKAFDLKGGVMYSLFGNPRYAYREMVYRKIITGKADQGMKVSGSRLLLILDKVIRNEE